MMMMMMMMITMMVCVCVSSSVYHHHCYTYHHYHHHQLKQHNVELLSDTNNYIGGTKLHFKLRLEAKDYAGIPIIDYLPIIDLSLLSPTYYHRLIDVW